MLDPQTRQHLFGLLRPPENYQLDRAIGTTYSLDLLTFLTIPLAFTFFSDSADPDKLTQDPLVLLDGVRRYAERILIFCQSGQIAVPKTSQQLFNYLEDRVFQVAPTSHEEAVFHPKVWLLRYHRPSLDSSVRYRLLVLSRNLTFDRSWDTALTLEGELSNRQNGYSRNRPLADFFAALPGLLIQPGSFPMADAKTMQRMQEEVRRVDFVLPPGFKDMAFVPIGLSRRSSWPFPEHTSSRRLVISPFLSAEFLTRFAKTSRNNSLISRPDSLLELSPAHLTPYQQIYVLSENASSEDEDNDIPEAGVSVSLTKEPLDIPLSGLHAKLFIIEQGYEATLWTGSANATNAAFHRNVEFLVQLTGFRKDMGINRLLAEGPRDTKQLGFLDLLLPFAPTVEPAAADGTINQLEKVVTRVQRRLARQVWCADVEPIQSEVNQEQYAINIRRQSEDGLNIPSGVSVTCWPITFKHNNGVSLNLQDSCIARLSPVSFAALTPFFVFEVAAAAGEKRHAIHFVLHIPLHNAPTDRRERILRGLLDNRQNILRYLLFLLAGEEDVMTALTALTQAHVAGSKESTGLPLSGAIFESMVTALHQQPEKLEYIAHLVADLTRSGNANLLPEGFDTIWQPIWQAKQRLYPPKQETPDAP